MYARRLVGAALAILLTVMGGSAPAWAGDDDELTGNPFTNPGEAGYELIGVQELGGVVKGPGVPAWLRACTHRQWTLLEKEGYFAVFTGAVITTEEIIARGDDPDEKWFVVFCSPTADALGISPQVLLTGVLATWGPGDPLPQVIIDWLIAYGYALVEIPLQVGSSSPVGDNAAPLITQLDTWLWVDSTVWGTRSATTPAVFGVTATVTADPYSVVFQTSEGEYIDCLDNIGSEYDYSRPGSSQATDCSVVFRDASSVADQKLTSIVRWGVTYSCSSSACPSGTLPDFVITTTRDVRVAEIVGVGTETGS